MPGRRGSQLGALCLLLVLGVAASADEDDGAPGTAGRVVVHDGVVSLTLAPTAQHRLALGIATVEPIRLPTTAPAMASVVDLAPLLALRQEVQRNALEIESGLRRQELANHQLDRLVELRKIGAVVSPEQQQAASAAGETVRAEIQLLQSQRAALAESLRYRWGEALASAAQSPRSELFSALAAHHLQLLLVTPSADAHWPAAPGDAEYQPPDSYHPRVSVRMLGPATRDGGNSTASWFALADDPTLRTGTTLALQLKDGPAVEGGRVASSALIWHAGQQWLYRLRGTDSFERIAVAHVTVLDASHSAVSGLESGSKVVVRGAQSLLGEELRWSIPGAGDD